MKSLFSKNSLIVLESLSFTKTLYAFDFDGTLAKIALTPSEAAITPSTDSLLRKLAQLAPVAVVSGRSLNDLKQRLRFRPPYLIGNHGLEGLENAKNTLREARHVSEKWKDKLSSVSFDSGVEIEDKMYSLAIHYRRSRNKKLAKSKINDVIEMLDPSPRIIAGKCVINLLPMGAPHKGIAVLDLMKNIGVKHVFYIGDDDTDEDVFNLADSRIMAVRVGMKKNSSARYFINRQSEINQLLKLLIRHHSQRPEARLGVRL